MKQVCTVNNKPTVVGTFSYADQFLACLRILTEKKYEIRSAFSPVRIPEMQEMLGHGPSPVRLFTLLGGIIGGTGLVAMAVYAHLRFNLIVWGKPVLAWVPWVVVAFEGTILFASLFSFVAWVFRSGLPQPAPEPGYDRAFSAQSFGVVVATTEESRDEIERLLKENGAEEVHCGG